MVKCYRLIESLESEQNMPHNVIQKDREINGKRN